MDFLLVKAESLQFDTMWLVVYIKNHRAIKFYQKNHFTAIGEHDFIVNEKSYKNTVFAKKI